MMTKESLDKVLLSRLFKGSHAGRKPLLEGHAGGQSRGHRRGAIIMREELNTLCGRLPFHYQLIAVSLLMKIDKSLFQQKLETHYDDKKSLLDSKSCCRCYLAPQITWDSRQGHGQGHAGGQSRGHAVEPLMREELDTFWG
ncbi:hypothetical protein CEXT_456651 [Caerostris extrusa]|uniref:Uncharacterized protein n=1 Tax=Caerostris extrusa TaxID=172846 RepID=A0AAV4YCV2_CAEEX|nr:hypothetical protein CEXT_456651 [Caerostris extrusa]